MDPGLCRACMHARMIRSGRGSTFWLCELSRTDPAFPRYPRLPVVRCSGFTLRTQAATEEEGKHE